MTITNVKKENYNSTYYSVYSEGEHLFNIIEEDWLALSLYEKTELSEDEVINIKQNINLKSSTTNAIKFLQRKLRTKKEVENKLKELGFDNDTITKTIEKLMDYGYIDDLEYTRRYIMDRLKINPKSKRLITIELLNKGIDTAIIEDVLDEMDIDDEVIAINLFNKKFKKITINDKTIKKINNYLAYRGFDYETIRKIININKK